EQHLLVERHHQVGLVAAVGDIAGSDADAVAAGAGDAARGRTDFGWDDLRGPDAVAHLRRDRAQRLAALLRAFARIADDFDDVFFQPDRRIPSRGRLSFLAGFLNRLLYGHVVHIFSVVAVDRWRRKLEDQNSSGLKQ